MIWFVAAAAASELRVVRSGDTVASIAATLGDPALAGAIRSLNGLGASDEPPVGRLLQLPPPVAPQVDQSAFLLSVVGDVTVLRSGGAAAPAQPFRSLDAGSVVCAGPKSFATVRVAAACEGQGLVNDDVTLLSDSCVELRSIVASALGRATVLRVRRGSIVVADPADGGRVTVEAGAGVAAGEGGFRVHREVDGAMRAEALTAELAVLGAGVERVLAPGTGARVLNGGGPTAPVDLLGERPLLAPAPAEPLGRPLFRWEEDPDAFGYVLSIAQDAAFTRVVFREPVASEVYAPSLLLLPLRSPEGLFWRVEPLDRLGYLGMPSAARPIGLPAGVQP